MQWNGQWDKKYFVFSFYISWWCNYHSLELRAFLDICRYLPIPLFFLNQRSICAIWSEIIKWLFLFLAFCWLQRQGGFYETQRHNGIIRNRAGSHAKVVKGVDDTNISKKQGIGNYMIQCWLRSRTTEKRQSKKKTCDRCCYSGTIE